MSPKTASALAVSLMVIAGAIVWNRMRDEDEPAGFNVAVETGTSKTSDRDESVPAGRLGVERSMEPGEELAATEEAGDQLVGQWLKTASAAFDQTSEHLMTDLGISAAQAGEVEEVFARRKKELESLLAGSTAGDEGDDRETIRKLCALIRNKGLRHDLVGVLSSEQLAAFDAREAKRERDTIEARAYRDMAEINSVVKLTDSQKPQVLGVL